MPRHFAFSDISSTKQIYLQTRKLFWNACHELNEISTNIHQQHRYLLFSSIFFLNFLCNPQHRFYVLNTYIFRLFYFPNYWPCSDSQLNDKKSGNGDIYRYKFAQFNSKHICKHKFVQLNILRAYVTNVNCRQNVTHAM